MAGVLVFGDMVDDRHLASLEVATLGASLADALQEPFLGALIGDDLPTSLNKFSCGFSSICIVSGKHYRPYTTEAFVTAAHSVIDACSPSVVLFPHNIETREWVPRLAAHLNAGLVMDCTVVDIQNSEFVATKPVYGGGVLGQFVVHGLPRMATIRAGIFEPHSVEGTCTPIHLDVSAPDEGSVTLIDQIVSAGALGPKLKNAKVVVSGGRGLGDQNNWHLIEETASLLDAAIGCSRPIADYGWVPSSHQVGLSGTSITPDLYIAIGISGAVQHLAGISGAKTVVAVNLDQEADIFSRATYGVVGDCREVLPAFIEQVKKLRS